MASPDQIIQQIRFGFETLNERNAQHEFEHLCRHFARARITFNILPATGPVAAGGDQGRDFETFRTFIGNSGPGHFSAIQEEKKLAFACSLEKRISTKVKADVSSIMSGGSKPDLIYFFSCRPVVVSMRHKLTQWAMEKYAIELEIIDCNALSEQLADSELFWIAARYLGIPPEIVPEPEKQDSEYKRRRTEWFRDDAQIVRFAELIEVARAARYALDEVQQDVTRWIALLIEYEARCDGDYELRRLRYEIIALTMRQTRSLRGHENRVRDFFSNPSVFDLPDLASEAETIHCYASTARILGEAALGKDEIDKWHAALMKLAEHGLESPASKNQLCLWLNLLGRMRMHLCLRNEHEVDYQFIFEPWTRLVALLAESPFFPVQEFHDDIMRTTELLDDPPILEDVLAKLRPYLAERAGVRALANSHFTQAEKFLNKNNVPRAIRELQAARIKWFTEETAEQSATCCLLLARCYLRMQLSVASIYYSLAASFIFANAGGTALHGLVHEGLYDAADACCLQGLWCWYFELSTSAIAIEAAHSRHGLDADKSVHFRAYLEGLPRVIFAVRRFLPSTFDSIIGVYRKIEGFESFLMDRMGQLDAKVRAWTDEMFEEALRNSFIGAPFCDAATNV